MRQRSHFRFIDHLGPRKLYESMQGAFPDRAARDRHASICDVCVAATHTLEAGEIDRAVEHWALGRPMEGKSEVQRTRGLPDSEVVWPAGCG